MKKAAGLSVGAIGFAILVIALDFAVIRAACLSPTQQERATTAAPLLPGTLAGRLLKRGPDGWAVFAFFLLPMINSLLVGVYRLRRRGDQTAGTVGYVTAGSVATLATFTSCVISPGTAIGMLIPISRRIALTCFYGLARLFGIRGAPAELPGWPTCLGMDLLCDLRGPYPDRVLLHPASPGGCHRGTGRPALGRGDWARPGFR